MNIRLILGAGVILVIAGCHRVEEPGGWLTPLNGGVVKQADFDDSFINVSAERRAALAARGQPEETEASDEETEAPDGETEATDGETEASDEEPEASDGEPEASDGEPEATDPTDAEAGAPAEGVDPAAAETTPDGDAEDSLDLAVTDDSPSDAVEAPAGDEAPAEATTPSPVAPAPAPTPVDPAVVGSAAVEPPAAVEVVTAAPADPASSEPPPSVAPAPPAPTPVVSTDLPVEIVFPSPPRVGVEPAAPVAGGPAPAPSSAVDLLPDPPQSDADAIASIDELPRSTAPSASDSALATLGVTPELCEVEEPLLVIELSDLSMLKWWVENGRQRAELVDREGRSFVVQVGDRVGAEGGKVVRIEPTEVVVGEIGFSLSGEPDILARSIKLQD